MIPDGIATAVVETNGRRLLDITPSGASVCSAQEISFLILLFRSSVSTGKI